MIKAISDFEYRFIINRTLTPTSKTMIQIKKTCDNCWLEKPLAHMNNGWQCCLECSQDIENLTNRLPPTSERD